MWYWVIPCHLNQSSPTKKTGFEEEMKKKANIFTEQSIILIKMTIFSWDFDHMGGQMTDIPGIEPYRSLKIKIPKEKLNNQNLKAY